MQIFWNCCHFGCMNTRKPCNTEQKFCGLFVNNFKNCENLTYEAKFAFFCGRICKKANNLVLVNLRCLSTICKLPWYITINLHPIWSHWPQSYHEARGQIIFFEAFEAKSSLWQNGHWITFSSKMQVKYDICTRMYKYKTLEAISASNSLKIGS